MNQRGGIGERKVSQNSSGSSKWLNMNKRGLEREDSKNSTRYSRFLKMSANVIKSKDSEESSRSSKFHGINITNRRDSKNTTTVSEEARNTTVSSSVSDVYDETEDEWSERLRESLCQGDLAPYKELRRPMMSRIYAPVQLITNLDIIPGETKDNCCTCCRTPSALSCFALLPCCGETEHLARKREAGKYIIVRENSVEWNEPHQACKPGSCCQLDIVDNVEVLYFDDAAFKCMLISRCPGHLLYERCFGGSGEVIHMYAPCWGGLCVRGTFPCYFVPICCSVQIFPCPKRYTMAVKNRDETADGRGFRMRTWEGAHETKHVLTDLRKIARKRLPQVELGDVVAGEEYFLEHKYGTQMSHKLARELELSPNSQEMHRDSRTSPSGSSTSSATEKGLEIEHVTHWLKTPSKYSSVEKDRYMLSRAYGPVVQLFGYNSHTNTLKTGEVDLLRNTGSSIPPGQTQDSMLACCYAPAFCPCWSLLPCCLEAQYLRDKRNASRYILLRENSIEWNEPVCTSAPGPCWCCGVNWILYDVKDNVQVVHYDDPHIKRVRNGTRYCNYIRTQLCGGQEDEIHVEAPLRCCCCVRGSLPCPLIPVCFLWSCSPVRWCPCSLRKSFHVMSKNENWGGADVAVALIIKSRVAAANRLTPKNAQE